MAEGSVLCPDLEEPAGPEDVEMGLEVLRLPEDLDGWRPGGAEASLPGRRSSR